MKWVSELQWEVKKGTGASGRIIIGVDRNVFHLQECFKQEYSLDIKIQRKLDGWEELVLAV